MREPYIVTRSIVAHRIAESRTEEEPGGRRRQQDSERKRKKTGASPPIRTISRSVRQAGRHDRRHARPRFPSLPPPGHRARQRGAWLRRRPGIFVGQSVRPHGTARQGTQAESAGRDGMRREILTRGDPSRPFPFRSSAHSPPPVHRCVMYFAASGIKRGLHRFAACGSGTASTGVSLPTAARTAASGEHEARGSPETIRCCDGGCCGPQNNNNSNNSFGSYATNFRY